MAGFVVEHAQAAIAFDGDKSLLRAAFERSLILTGPQNIHVVNFTGACREGERGTPGDTAENALPNPWAATRPRASVCAVVIARKDPGPSWRSSPRTTLIRDTDKLKEGPSYSSVQGPEVAPALLFTWAWSLTAP